jgi:hypothetical protein
VREHFVVCAGCGGGGTHLVKCETKRHRHDTHHKLFCATRGINFMAEVGANLVSVFPAQRDRIDGLKEGAF